MKYTCGRKMVVGRLKAEKFNILYIKRINFNFIVHEDYMSAFSSGIYRKYCIL